LGGNPKIRKNFKTMHECCLVVIIVECVEMWRMNWKEIEILCLIVMEKFG
jgi:hypothetical protein